MFSCIFLTPCALLWWSGTWQLLDSYVSPNDSLHSRLVSLAFGSAVSCLGYVLKAVLHHFRRRFNKVILIPCHYALIYLHSLGDINFWRGVWDLRTLLLKKYSADSDLLLVSMMLVAITFLSLLLLRSVSNCISLPVSCVHDVGMEHARPKPKYRSQVPLLTLLTLT